MILRIADAKRNSHLWVNEAEVAEVEEHPDVLTIHFVDPQAEPFDLRGEDRAEVLEQLDALRPRRPVFHLARPAEAPAIVPFPAESRQLGAKISSDGKWEIGTFAAETWSRVATWDSANEAFGTLRARARWMGIAVESNETDLDVDEPPWPCPTPLQSRIQVVDEAPLQDRVRVMEDGAAVVAPPAAYRDSVPDPDWNPPYATWHYIGTDRWEVQDRYGKVVQGPTNKADARDAARRLNERRPPTVEDGHDSCHGDDRTAERIVPELKAERVESGRERILAQLRRVEFVLVAIGLGTLAAVGCHGTGSTLSLSWQPTPTMPLHVSPCPPDVQRDVPESIRAPVGELPKPPAPPTLLEPVPAGPARTWRPLRPMPPMQRFAAEEGTTTVTLTAGRDEGSVPR